jgi:very-short-patch-repair endonuclease
MEDSRKILSHENQNQIQINIETILNNERDENVYEIDPKITWESLQQYRKTSNCKEFNIILDKFQGNLKKPFPRGFWNSIKTHKLYMLILRIKLGFYRIESLYTIKKEDLTKNYGYRFYDKHNNNLSLILTSLYPEHENLKMFGSFKGLTTNGKLKVECWSKTNKKQPHEVFMSTHEQFEFICDQCQHPFSSRLTDIVRGQWCPYCANQKLCEDTLSCQSCLAKTFFSFDGKASSGKLKVECWSKTNKQQPHEVALNCHDEFEFTCDECHHPFKSGLHNIVKGQWCPYCANRKLCEDTLSCEICLNKTFHSFDGKTSSGKLKVECWSPANKKQPHEVFMFTHEQFEFICDECHHPFKSALHNIVKGNWCPTCKNKTEKLVLEFVQNLYSKKDVKRQFKHKKVRNIRELPFDICILPHKIIIEVDGRQHFENVSFFGNSNAKNQCERDCEKMKIIFEEGYSIIRIVQQDVWKEKSRDQMLRKLSIGIQDCINSESPMIHYLSIEEHMYQKHKDIFILQ